MQRVFIFLFLAFAFACSNERSEDESAPPSAAAPEQELVGGPLMRNAFHQFIAEKQPEFNLNEYEPRGSQMLPANTSPLNEASISDYKDLLIYNEAKTKAVDLFSYGSFIKGKTLQGGEPDSEAALLDFENNTRRRLLYLGPSFGFADAQFQGDTVMISGYEIISDSLIRPISWLVNLKENRIESFEYRGNVAVSTAEYFRRRFAGYRFD